MAGLTTKEQYNTVAAFGLDEAEVFSFDGEQQLVLEHVPRGV